ncbi:MAG: hypothetical protein AAFU81_12375, partial [Pseudomonadota bacterium]
LEWGLKMHDDLIDAVDWAVTEGITTDLFPDEGHGFARPENRLAFFGVTEGFLATCLGGRVEPIGDDFTGSSLTIPVGADVIEGLPEALEGFEAEERG